MSSFVEVLLDLPLKQSFTYSVPEALQNSLLFGRRVVVPFGKREMTGYVVKDLDEFTASYTIKSIKRVIDDG
ncbi:MAG: primosomal protein N', partial [Spirochaetia bacterium]|nr:primosomal protein N' [Spirochaetia bacterium]